MNDAVPLGRFVWFELMTTEFEPALSFYRDVIGWRPGPADGAPSHYMLFHAGEMPVAGCMRLADAQMEGVPPHWMAYISTPDPDGTAELARTLGGEVLMSPGDVADVGRFGVIRDPQGAVIGLLRPEYELPPEAEPQPLTFSWNELATTDPDAAARFYQELFGWEIRERHDMGEMGEYQIFGRDRFQYGGMYQKPADMPAPPHWLHYAMVDDADAAVERARKAGGTVLHGPMDVPGGDRVAIIQDPLGAVFAVHAAAR